jgi:hypothetical protein
MLPALFVDVTLNAGDERIAKLIALLEQHGEEHQVRKYVEQTDEDLLSARLLWLSPGSDCARSHASRLGTKYDLTHACPHCGTGAKQISHARVTRKDMSEIRKTRALMSFDYYLFVDTAVRKMLTDAGITGISFAEVYSRDSVGFWEPIDREQVLIENSMPPLRGELTAEDEQELCKVCRRGGHSWLRKKTYREEDLIGMKDFNLTWEWFGSYSFDGKARGAEFSVPQVIVTPKVLHIFREAGVKSFKWEPVDLEP